MFGGSVGRSIACCEFALHAGNAHNLPTFILDHVAEETLNVAIGPINVHVEHAEMILKIVVSEFTTHGNTSVFNHHIQSSAFAFQLPNHFLSYSLNLFIITHVQLENLDLLLVLAVAFDSFQLLNVPGRQDKMCSILAELVGKILSDARGGAGDPNSFIAVVGLGEFAANNFDERVEYKQENDRLDYEQHGVVRNPQKC